MRRIFDEQMFAPFGNFNIAKLSHLSRRKFILDKRFQSIPEAARTMGLSTFYVRQRAKAGTIPVLKAGVKFLVDVPATLELLAREAQEGVQR